MVEIKEEPGELIVRVGGQEYARYQFGAPRWKPYLYPLRASNGLSLLADSPTDHRHHHGLWVGHGRVDDNDFWLERHNSGKIVHRKFDNITGGQVGGFTEQCDWVAHDGSVVLSDVRTFTFYDGPPDARLFDFELTLKAAPQSTVNLYPTNEAGLPQLRVNDGLAVKAGGAIVNAEGQRNERGTYRQRSPWIDCSGTLGRLTCGVAIFDNPRNPEFPTPWFTRDYGPVSPNYGFFQEDPIALGPRKPLRLRYRVFTHSGNAEEANVASVWEQYRASATAGEPADAERQATRGE
ncbi:MAG TPA: PmoA family protein [Chthonomonadales bacterium]|nr:PmoA family protein [Chthonomonadales bacterium]